MSEAIVANLQEALQYWLIVWGFDTARYLFGAGSVALVLYVVCRRFSSGRRIQLRRARATDVSREVRFSLLTTAVYATVALVTVQLERAGYLTFYGGLDAYPLWYTVLSVPLLLILHDAYYWAHRLMHLRPVFRLVHRIHHRSLTPTTWAAYAFAPGEAFLMALFVPLAAFCFPVHEIAMLVFLTIMIVRNAMGHSGIEFHPAWWVDSPLDIFTTVTHHDLHHQRSRGNYGLYFTWWDRWMGTEFADYKACFRSAAGGEPVNKPGAAPVG
ncbi:MAG: sterol desaturase family protein [Halioglobus sp.]